MGDGQTPRHPGTGLHLHLSHQDPNLQGLRPPQVALEGGVPMFPPPDRTRRSVPKVTRSRGHTHFTL